MDNRKISDLTVDEFRDVMLAILHPSSVQEPKKPYPEGCHLPIRYPMPHGIEIDCNPGSGTFGMNISPFR